MSVVYVNRIPKKIIQIAIGDAYVKKLPLEKIKNKLLDINKGYEYILLTEPVIRIFLKHNFPEYEKLYDTIQRPQFKSDLIRYLFLYIHGGYYVDIDLYPIMSFDTIIEKSGYPNLLLGIGVFSGDMCNGLIGSIPKHSILMEAFKLLEKNPNHDYYGNNVRNLYQLCLNRGPVVAYNKTNGVFYLKENRGSNNMYAFYINDNEIAYYSNYSGYPFKDF